MKRTRSPRPAVNEMVRNAQSVLNGIVSDSGDLLEHYQAKEMDEEGSQYEQHMQKARAVRRIATEIQEGMRKLVMGLAAEERLHNGP